MTSFSLALELTMLIAFWLSLSVLQKDGATPGRRVFVLLALATAAWAFGELALERQVLDVRIADRIKYAGAMALPALWLGVACHAAHWDVARRVPWFPAIPLAPFALVYALLYSPTWDALFVGMVAGEYVYGPLWWVVTYLGYGLVAAGCGVLLHGAIFTRPFRLRPLLLAVVSCAPLAANLAYLSSGFSWDHDPSALGLGVALLALCRLTFSGGVLQLLPVSQLDLVRQLPFGVLLVDGKRTVLSANPAAEQRLRMSEEKAVGRTLEAVMEDSRGEYRVSLVPLRSLDVEVGQIVLLDPPKRRAP